MPVAVRSCLRIAPGHIPTGVSLVHQCFPDLLVVRAIGAGPYGLIRYHYSCLPFLSAKEATTPVSDGGLAGSCPGRAPVALGADKLAAIINGTGIVGGAHLHGIVRERMRPARGAALAPAVSTD
jgi:hypothetical protein